MGIKSIALLFKVVKDLGLRSFFKTVRFNLHYFGIKKGSRLPVFVSKNVHFNAMQGEIVINSLNTGHVRIGFGDVGIFDKKFERTVLRMSKGAKIIFNGACDIGHGSRISVQSNAELILGNYFCITAQSTIICARKISFGDRVLISWDVQIMDTDFHKIYENNTRMNFDDEVVVGDDVWINSRSMILKGCVIPTGCVVGAGSVCNKKYEKINCILAGVPAKVIRENISWAK